MAVQYVLGPDREAREWQTRRRQNRDREARAERTLTVAAADVENTVREDLARHGDELRTALARHTEDMRQLVESRFAQLDRAPEPYPPLDRVRMDGVPELAQRFADVLAPGSPLLYSFIRL
ncbi:hypothetical protein [Streptomyces sp. NPDC055186]